MKEKTIRTSVYKTKTRRQFFVQTIKGWKDFVQVIIGVYYGTFDLQALLRNKMRSGYVMRSGLLRIMFI